MSYNMDWYTENHAARDRMIMEDMRVQQEARDAAWIRLQTYYQQHPKEVQA